MVCEKERNGRERVEGRRQEKGGVLKVAKWEAKQIKKTKSSIINVIIFFLFCIIREKKGPTQYSSDKF